jgi:polysaccharide chain length determinant protein (PEP-CTERM system associated)
MHDLYVTALYYVSAIWKRRWATVLIATAISIVGWIAVILIPDSYQSSARIYVDTSNVLQPLLRGMVVQSNLQAQVQLMQQTLLTRPNLQSVARTTDYDLTATTPDEMKLLIEGLQDRTVVIAERGNLFSISYTDSEAQRAHDVVVALLEIFVENNIGESRKEFDVARDFIEDQIESYERQLQEAENRLAVFQQDNMHMLSGEGGFLGRATVTQQRLKLIELELKQAIAERNVLSRELASVPEYLPPNAAVSGGPPSDASFRLLEAEAQLRSLMSRYTENHPDVIAIQRQVDELLASAEAERNALAEYADTGDDSGVTGPPNPLYNQLKLRLIDQESRIGSLRQKVTTVSAEFADLNQLADDVPMVEAEFKQLNRDYSVLNGKHSELLASREAAKLSREREKRGDEVTYRLVEPATVPLHPSGPNRPLLLSGVLGLSFIAGIAFSLALVLLDSSFWSVKDLQQRLNMPIYGTVSEISGFANTASSSAGVLLLSLFVTALLATFSMLMMLESQVGLGSLSLESVTPDLLANSFETLRSMLFRIFS